MRIPKKLAALGIGLFLTLVSAEIALRIATKAPGLDPLPKWFARDMYEPHPTRDYAGRPGFTGEVERGGRRMTVHFNERGFNDRPFAVEPGASVVLAVGDSFTEGFGLDPEQAWPRRLEAHLDAAGGERRWRVLNAGVSGYNLHQARMTAAELLPEVRPQIVVVGVHLLGCDRLGNPYVLHEGFLMHKSAVRFTRVEADCVFNTPFRRRWVQDLDQWLNHHTRVGAWMLRLLRILPDREPAGESEGAVRQAIAPLLAEVGQLRDVVAGANATLVVLPVVFQNKVGEAGVFGRGQDVYERQLAEYCEAEHIPCARVLATLQERSGGKPIFKLPDDLHWSAAAADIAAELLAPVVARVQGSR